MPNSRSKAKPGERCPKCGKDHGSGCVGHSSRTGKACGKRRRPGAMVCATHGGSAPQVKAAADQRVRDMLADAIDPNRVLREVGRLAYSNVQDLYDDDGRLRPVKEWPEDIARAVSGIEVVRGNVDKGDGKFDQVLKIRLHPKGERLQDLMKHHGQLTDKVQLEASDDLMALLLEGRRRAAEARK